MTRTEISSLGEFGLIDRFQKQIKLQNATSKKGISDDAAVIAPREGEQFVVSTDMLVEGIHFDLTFHPLKHLGYKAAVVNLSDIAAMNAIPEQLTLSMALSNRFSVEAVDEIYEGVLAACEKYKVDLIGGDTTSSPRGLVLSLTAIGQAKPEQIVYRNGAKKGDIICVTGDLGGAYIGLQLLNREKQVFVETPDVQPELSGHDYVLQRYLRPEARTDIVHELREKNIKPTAMIDISDGLSSEVLHICRQSGLGVVLFEKNIPVDYRTEKSLEPFNLGAMTAVLHGGDEYELLFTISQNDYELIKNHPDIHFIGYMTEPEKGQKLVMISEQVIDITAQGWNHFQG
ncbi:MAG: thiamine-phosphate kinase [Bacteroidota bacterium]